MEQFLQGNVPLRHLLNEETVFMSWQTRVDSKDLALYQVSTSLKLSQKKSFDNDVKNSVYRSQSFQP